MQFSFRRPVRTLLGLALFAAQLPAAGTPPPAPAAWDAWLDSTSAQWDETAQKIWAVSSHWADVESSQASQAAGAGGGVPAAGSWAAKRARPRSVRTGRRKENC